MINIDDRINKELEFITRNIENVTGVRYSKPMTVRFLIKHYNAAKSKIEIKQKPRSKDFIFS